MVNQFGGATLKYASHNLETPSGADQYDSEGNETHSQILKRWNSIVGCNHVEITSQTEAVSISMPASPNPRKVGKTKPIEMKHKNKAEAGRRISKADGYSTFKTRSVQFERQIPNLRRMPWSKTEAKNSEVEEEAEALPAAERYFDALEGPELESLKASEKLLLPEDEKWPFLLRVPISTFGIALGLSIQALLWKTMATSPAMRFLHVKLAANYVVWCFAIAAMILVASVYLLKTAVFFEAVRREFSHPVRVNFFFAPWIGCILLVVSSPPPVARHLQHEAVWYVLMTPVLILHLKIYGEWMMGGERTLSKVANPLNHLPLAGNFSVALLGSFVGLKEWPVFFFSVGLAHYVVLFVTLYQRLPTNQTLPKELHPVFFLFIAVPSLACLSWTMIAGTFDLVSRIAYFLAMFLYASLVVRFNFFRGFRFSLVWWAYTVPMSSASIATITYTAHVTNLFTKILSVALSFISTLTVLSLLVFTVIHAFVFRTLFPNDIAIAITVKRSRSKKKKKKKNISNNRVASLPSPNPIDEHLSFADELSTLR